MDQLSRIASSEDKASPDHRNGFDFEVKQYCETGWHIHAVQMQRTIEVGSSLL